MNFALSLLAVTAFYSVHADPPICHSVISGDACYDHVHWAKYTGIYSNPGTYPGLTSESSMDDFQQFFYDLGVHPECNYPPCTPEQLDQCGCEPSWGWNNETGKCTSGFTTGVENECRDRCGCLPGEGWSSTASQCTNISTTEPGELCIDNPNPRVIAFDIDETLLIWHRSGTDKCIWNVIEILKNYREQGNIIKIVTARHPNQAGDSIYYLDLCGLSPYLDLYNDIDYTNGGNKVPYLLDINATEFYDDAQYNIDDIQWAWSQGTLPTSFVLFQIMPDYSIVRIFPNDE